VNRYAHRTWAAWLAPLALAGMALGACGHGSNDTQAMDEFFADEKANICDHWDSTKEVLAPATPADELEAAEYLVPDLEWWLALSTDEQDRFKELVVEQC
jgi:hypothetical protein